ncbi:MAG: iron ABC transporter substrate-binding protein [Candidatus Poribacteria bacterium]|nr:iron ABC transporter substrate-binding protein [Candidatus Poribacteria bacterium]
MFKNHFSLFKHVLPVLLVLTFVGPVVASNHADETLTIYSGRSKSLVEPIIKQFQEATGIQVKANYGGTTQLAAALLTEGGKSPAALFWAQDAGALGAVSKKEMFEKLPEAILMKVPSSFRDAEGFWVATSGRARVLAYSSERVKMKELPESIFDLTQPMWKGRVGWAPTNASFQAFVTSLRVQVGEEKTKEWLLGMKANGVKKYAKNTPIIEALAAGEIDAGLPNHYYLLRFKKTDANYPVAQTFFKASDPGNLVNIAGVGVLKTAENKKAALKFVEFLLSIKAQQYFTSDVFEYPVTEGVTQNENLVPLSELIKVAPVFNLNDIDDLDGTVKLLQAVEIL